MTLLALKRSMFALEGISSHGMIEGLQVKSYKRKIPPMMLVVTLDALSENILRMKTDPCVDALLQFLMACEAVVI